ncbi:protein arginine N-methyltransferase 5, putative, partial [Hepatocystis sp. ex Piliocolobus tephrosceles]
MPIKNKYATLKIGIECNYNDIDEHTINTIDPDFLVSSLCKNKNNASTNNDNGNTNNTNTCNDKSTSNSSSKNQNDSHLNPIKHLSNFTNSSTYEVEPLFGNEIEDTNKMKGKIYGSISEWINPDNDNEQFREYCMDALNKEIQWGGYISVPKLIINSPAHDMCANYARCINSYIYDYNSVPMIVKIPIAKKIEQVKSGKDNQNIPSTADHDAETDSTTPTTTAATTSTNDNNTRHTNAYNNNQNKRNKKNCVIINGWNIWNNFVSYCDFNIANLSVGLELVNTKDVDISNIHLEVWKSEPVKLIIIPLYAFIIDSKSQYPVLPQKIRNLLVFFFRQNIEVVLTDKKKKSIYDCCHNAISKNLEPEWVKNDELANLKNKHKSSNRSYSDNSNGNKKQSDFDMYFIKCCIYYIKRLFMSIENFDNDFLHDYEYWDYLQLPMQPLKDNLTSQVYEIFEKDKKKYEQYEKAINMYFEDELRRRERDKIECGKKDDFSIECDRTKTETFDNKNDYTSSYNQEFVIFVVGAGRGPLVDCTINALEKNKIKKYEIYAIEKNDNVIVILKNRALKARWKNVKVVNSDMRQLKIKKKADLIVSELLGSFGDNELFPECLDGVQHYLKKNGISIPKNCVSYLEPISCSGIH